MPEYLAPGVYVEEIDSGPKPIEGVSTSTCGMVGMTERGPTDVPILVTSAGEFDRWFGGILDPEEFTDPSGRVHCYLPHAVEGFFTNGGKRAYVVRVTPPAALFAQRGMFWADPTVAEAQTVLLRGAAQGTGTGTPAATNYPLYVISDALLANGDSIRIGDGSSAEYVTIANPNGITAGVTHHIPLSAPASLAHPAGSAIREHAPTPVGLPAAGPPTPRLNAATAAGSTELFVECGDDLAAFAAGPPPAADRLPWLAQLSLNSLSDLVVVTAVEPAGMTNPPGPVPISRLILNQPLQGAYPAGQAVTIIQSEATTARNLRTDVTPGDLMVFGNGNVGATAIIELDRGQPQHEAFLRGALVTLSFTPPLPFAAPAGTIVREVTLTAVAVPPKATTAAAAAGSQTLSLDNRDGLVAGQLVRIGTPALEEFATILTIPGDPAPAPNPGTITLSQPLARDHAVNTAVQLHTLGVPGAGQPTARLLLDAPVRSTTAIATDGSGWTAGQFAELRSPENNIAYVRMTAASALVLASTVALTANLRRTHATASIVAERQRLFDVQALDAGAWGNRLRISVENEARGLALTTTGVLTPPLQVGVASLTGLEPGSLIELRNPTNGATVLVKVQRVDRTAGTVILDAPGLNPATLAALGPITQPLDVRSREFKLIVLLRRRPDPAIPSRNDQIQATEVFAHLSMDHRHSRYFQQIIGATTGPPRLEDNRPEGESAFIRVLDSVQDNATEVIRPGPETLVDMLPGNVIRAARHPLENGDDSLATMSSAAYLGNDNIEPRLRTGLESLRNLPEISLVAIPGQTRPEIQAGLIAHCEAMRYRFAILDSEGGRNASITQVRQQRQQFDTKYAALYYPWLTIPDPTPDNLANIGPFALPPSGHVLGLIARVDNERGVHKAPANEVVRGITGITRLLQKAEHDILNPSPVNVNVIRDFRPDGRSIRLFGARCITSDQEHKYVNVRRLLIFLEQSIERGLQWVVFEPNAEPLWARVEQSVANFLTDVWRAGALEGTEPAQGFFVKCDRTTMTQSQIDNGQLIVVIGVAPVKPAEFVIIRIGLTTRTAEAA